MYNLPSLLKDTINPDSLRMNKQRIVQNMCKVHTSSHEVTNAPYVRANDENTTTTVTLTINYDVEKNTSQAEKIKNVGEYNFEIGANDCELDIKRQ